MPVQSVLKARGLYNSDNPYSAAPEGSLETADNIVIPNKDVIEPRRGQETLTYGFGSSNDRGTAMAFYGSTPVVQYGTALAYDTGSAMTAYSGTNSPPDSALLRMKFAEARQNLYFTTAEGVKVLDSSTGSPINAGVSRPFDIEQRSVTSLYGTPGALGSWLTKDSAVAYRALLGRKDANNYVKWSAPSGRAVIVNPPDVTMDLSKAVGGLVTATVVSGTHLFLEDDTFTVSPGGAGSGSSTFATSGLTVAASGLTATQFQYSDSADPDAGTLSGQTISSGTKKVKVVVYLPSSAIAGDYIRIFRSESTGEADIDPGDELFLVHEGILTATDITNKYYDPSGSGGYIDTTPDALLGDIPCPTNPRTGEGIDSASYPPPLAKDITYWQDRMWFANSRQYHRLEFQMLGVGSPDGVQTSDIVLCGDYSHIADTDFTVSTGFSAPTNVERTARDLARTIGIRRRAGNSGFSAYYISGENESPGRLLIERATISSSSDLTGYFAATRPASWNPNPPTLIEVTEASTSRTGSTVTVTTATAHGFTAGQSVYLSANSADGNFPVGVKTIATVPTNTTFTYTEAGNAATMGSTYFVCAATVPTDGEVVPNRLYYSKLQEPEAVPLVNYLDVGSKNHAILRVIALRDQLLVVKEDGFYTVSGQYPFRVDALDTTAKPIGPDTFVTLNNLVYGLTDQGVVTVSAGGVSVLSRPIEASIRPLLNFSSSANAASVKAAVFGCAYEQERSYLLWLPSVANSSTIGQCFAYNYFTNTWVRRTDAHQHAVVSPTGLLYTVRTDANRLSKERKAFTSADYADMTTSTVLIDSVVGSTLYLASVANVSAGSYLVTSAGSGVVTSVNASDVTVTVVGSGFLDGEVATIYSPITCTVKWNPYTAGSPATLKQFAGTHLHFGESSFSLGYASFTTPTQATSVTEQIDAYTYIQTAGNGVVAATRKDFHELVPAAKQYGQSISVGFSLAEARAKWRLYGYSVNVADDQTAWGAR